MRVGFTLHTCGDKGACKQQCRRFPGRKHKQTQLGCEEPGKTIERKRFLKRTEPKSVNVEEGERVRRGRLLRRDARGSSERVEKQRAGYVTSVRRWCWWCRRRWQEVTAVEEEDGEERSTASATSLCDERPSSAFLSPPHVNFQVRWILAYEGSQVEGWIWLPRAMSRERKTKPNT
jgi:hypothetical protein